jgi:hypothetical protein
MSAYLITLTIHSWLRWVVLILAIYLVIRSLQGWFGKQSYTSGDNKLAVFFTIGMHTQLLLGLILYFALSPAVQQAFKDFGAAMKDANIRVWAVEHITMMVLAVILAQVGRSMSKKTTDSTKKFRLLAIFGGLALVLMLAGIPWSKIPLFRM